ncbi:DUF6225 family protein [Streptomyces sp. JV185]|nr:DUF6225 family protein [Streptomyces sp. JV185]MEE1770008.1 DUF6225 family protein [Streptomyces sp. JV185]
MTDVFELAPQVWNAAQLRNALKDLPDDAYPCRRGRRPRRL